MNGRTSAIAALVGVSAFSALPSAFYQDIADATGTPWSTALLFSAHGAAAIVGMVLIAPRVSRPARILVGMLALDVAGGVLMAFAAPGSLGLLLTARVVCGLALGAATSIATALLVRASGGAVVVTAGIFGGVGAGAIAAGLLAAAGAGAALTLALGAGALAVVAVICGLVPAAVDTSSPASLTLAAGGSAMSPVAPLGAFGANGVLALFTSLVPAQVARLVGGAGLVAGLTAGVAMLAAGLSRLALHRVRGVAAVALAAGAAVAGAAMFLVGLVLGDAFGAASAIAGGAILGAAAGLVYDGALRGAGQHRRAIGVVQGAGQAGLVVPPLIATAVIA